MSDEQNAAVIDRLVQAYNAGDMDGFLGCFADGAKIYRGRDEVAFDGKDAIRAEYQPQFDKGFKNNPGDRIVVGRHIAERERVTAGQGGGETDFLTIYTVENGAITVGRHIAQRERVSAGQGETDFLSIYTVENGAITRVDFLGAEVTAKS